MVDLSQNLEIPNIQHQVNSDILYKISYYKKESMERNAIIFNVDPIQLKANEDYELLEIIENKMVM